MNERMLALIKDGLSEMGLDAENPGTQDVVSYLSLLLEKNKVMNLSAIREEDAAVRLHALDALAIFGCLELAGKSVLDVGTGGGVPGALLKLYAPKIRLSLLDSTAKKLAFVEQALSSLGAEAAFYPMRAEDFAHGKGREQFDVVTARAVAALPALCELCLPFVRVGGVFAAYKAASAMQELEDAQGAISILGGKALAPHGYEIPGEEGARCIILIEKIKPTPALYPRPWAKIKQKNL